jgi:hypothetical protein
VEGRTELIFLPFKCRLRFFEIHASFSHSPYACGPHDFDFLSFLMRSLCISLTSPATLQHLEFNFEIDKDYFDLHCVTFYVISCVIWTPLPLIQTVQSYNELTYLSTIPIMQTLSRIHFRSMKSKKLSLMVYLYFALKVFCSSMAPWSRREKVAGEMNGYNISNWIGALLGLVSKSSF